MKKTFTLSMSWLHTWGGLAVGWVLFCVLLTGSIAVFNSELTYWLTPEMRDGPLPDRQQTLRQGVEYLQARAPDSRLWRIVLPTGRDPVLTLSWRSAKDSTTVRRLDPKTMQPLPRLTEGGAFFLKVHEGLHMDRDRNPIGLFVVGLTGVAMLVACVSGIVVHKRIFKDFFLFRRGASSHRAWLDAHNVFGVVALPFHIVMAYTGLVLLYWIYVPAAVQTLFHGDTSSFRVAALTQEYKTVTDRVGAPAGMVDPVVLMARAEQQFGVGKLAYLYVRDPHRTNAVMEAYRVRDDRIGQQVDQIAYDGVSGRELRALHERSLVFQIQSFVASLHWIEWGGAAARWCYFLAGLMSSAMMAAGLVVFAHKRQRGADTPAWLGVIEALNVAAIAGLCVASSAFLWAERLTPLQTPDRAQIPVAVFFGVWLAMAIHAALRPVRRAWVEQLALSAILCLGAPALGGLAAQDFARGDTVRVGVDLTLAALGLLFGFGAWRAARPPRPAPARRRASQNLAEA